MGVALRHASVALLVGAVLWVDSIFYGAVVPMLGFLSDEVALGKGDAGLLVAAYPAAMVVAALPVATLAARWHGRATVLLGLALMAAGCLLFGLSGSLAGLLVARALQGVGSAASWIGGLAWIAQSTPEERRAETFGTALGIGFFGTQFGPVVGVLATAVGRAPAFTAGVVAATVLAAGVLRAPSVPSGAGGQGPRMGSLNDDDVRVGLLLVVASSLCLGVIDVLAPLTLNDHDIGASALGAIFFAAATLLGVGSRLTGRAIDRAGPARPTLVALVGSVACVLVLGLTELPVVVGTAVILGSACLGSLWGPGMHLLARGSRRLGADEASAPGAFMWAWAVGFTLGSAFGGALGGAFGNSYAYLLSGLTCLPAMLMALQHARRAAALGGV